MSRRNQIEKEFVSSLVDAAIRDKGEALADVGAWFSPDWILDPFLRDVAAGVFKLAQKHEPITASMLAAAVRVPGKKYDQMMEVATLIQTAYGWWHLRYMANRVYDEHRRITAAHEAGQAIEGLGYADSLDEALGALKTIPDKYQPLAHTRHNDNLQAFDEILADLDGKAPERIKTGLSSLDDITSGFGPGNLVIVGANTSAGKSAFLCHCAIRLAMHKRAVTYHSLEMSPRELYSRWARWISGVCETARREYIGGVGQVHHLVKEGLIEVYTSSVTIAQIEADLTAARSKRALAAAFVDYVQLVRGESKESRERQVADVTRRLKVLAGQCQIPIFAAAQLNRQAGESPRMCHLRESGAIEQDANCVILLDPCENWQNMARPDVKLVVAKNRHGRTGDVTVQWDRARNLYTEPEPERFTDLDDWGNTDEKMGDLRQGQSEAQVHDEQHRKPIPRAGHRAHARRG